MVTEDRIARASGETDPESAKPPPPRDGQPIEIESFRPVAESLLWRLGQASWERLGRRSFTSGNVPHLITSDGERASAAARTLYANCEAAQAAGRLESKIVVIELAAGLGLHAEAFLDAFRNLCVEHGREHYARLEYWITDGARAMVSDAVDAGIASRHTEHVAFGVVDALQPDRVTRLDGSVEQLGGIRCIVHNYMLGVLPFDLLMIAGGEVRRLEARTVVTTDTAPRDLVSIDWDELLYADGEDERRLLAGAKRHLSWEWRCVPYSVGETDGDSSDTRRDVSAFVRQRLGGLTGTPDRVDAKLCLAHCHGALASLDGSFDVLRKDGFLVFGDFGGDGLDDLFVTTEFQTFGESTASGIPFTFLDFALRRDLSRWSGIVTPAGDRASRIHSRLLLRTRCDATERTFRDAFRRRTVEGAERRLSSARRAARRGDLADARKSLLALVESGRAPWRVLLEWAELENREGNHAFALEAATEACELSPNASSEAWMERGVALHALDDAQGATAAAREALRLDGGAFRTLYQGAHWALDAGRFSEALEWIGRLLALDHDSRRTRQLLALQQRCLEGRAAEQRAWAKEPKAREGATDGILRAAEEHLGAWQTPPAHPPVLMDESRSIEAAELALMAQRNRYGGWVDPRTGSTGAASATARAALALGTPPRRRQTESIVLGALRGLTRGWRRTGWGGSRDGSDPLETGWTLRLFAHTAMLDVAFTRRAAAAHIAALPTAFEVCAPVGLLGLALVDAGVSHAYLVRVRKHVLACLASEPKTAVDAEGVALALELLRRSGGVPASASDAARVHAVVDGEDPMALAGAILVASELGVERRSLVRRLTASQRNDGAFAPSDGDERPGAAVPATATALRAIKAAAAPSA
ncbi:MAG: tetratricopeptide repeat protein [Planctomycetota bacterium]